MKEKINDLLLKMQSGENCIGDTANELCSLFGVSGSYSVQTDPLKCIKCDGSGLLSGYSSAYKITNGKGENFVHCDRCKGKGLMI